MSSRGYPVLPGAMRTRRACWGMATPAQPGSLEVKLPTPRVPLHVAEAVSLSRQLISIALLLWLRRGSGRAPSWGWRLQWPWLMCASVLTVASMSLHLGNEVFDVYKAPLQGDHNHLFIRQGTGLQGQAVFKTKLTFR